MSEIYRQARDTLTAIELDRGDTLHFRLRNGEVRTLTLEDTSAAFILTNIDRYGENHPLGRSMYHFACHVRIDGQPMMMERYVCSQETFYEPYVINGMRIWFDAVADIFTLIKETHGACRPSKQARFAIQDMTLSICPQELQSWCPDEGNFIDIERCYNGDDPWMGPYLGFDAHGGLDINHPKGTPIWAPIDLDDQFYFNSLEMGDNNNRWRAIRTWPDGSTWTLQTAHMVRLLVPEHTPVKAGTHIAEAAGVLVGSHEHSHFVFKVREAADPQAGADAPVEVRGHISEDAGDDYVIQKGQRRVTVPKRYLVHLQRPNRREDSVFVVPRSFAEQHALDHVTPEVLLDPWIIFWQIFRQKKERAGEICAQMAPLSPAKTGQEVQFHSDGSHAGSARGTLRYFWTFGDGGFAVDPHPSHVYLKPGVYPVTLTVDDGVGRAAFTQHLTVDGQMSVMPGLALDAPRELSFRARPVQAMDVYGWPIRHLPHTLTFVARTTRPRPDAKEIKLRNAGGGTLPKAHIEISPTEAAGWLTVHVGGSGNAQQLTVGVNAEGLLVGTYEAWVAVETPGAVNSPQRFRVILEVRNQPPQTQVILDDQDPGFCATPYFWVGHRFDRWETPGYGGFYLVNGRRAREGEYARFTPDLAAGRYEVRLHEQTPFDPDARFWVRVRHLGGEEKVWIHPATSRLIGIFPFAEGTDGYVELLADGAEGQVVADAVVFTRLGDL